MTAKTLVVVLIFVTNFRVCYTEQYDNYTLLSFKPTKKAQLQFLQTFTLQKYMNMKFWKKPHKLHDEVQLMIDMDEIELFLERAQFYNLKPTISTYNVQK